MKINKQTKEDITFLINIIIVIWLFLSILSSLIVGVNQLKLDNISYNSSKYSRDDFTYGCSLNTPWTHIFYSKLFCQLRR